MTIYIKGNASPATFKILRVHWVMPGSIQQALSSWDGQITTKSNNLLWRGVPMCIFWSIRLGRNGRCFFWKERSHVLLKIKCRKSLFFLCRKKMVTDFDSLFYLLSVYRMRRTCLVLNITIFNLLSKKISL